jgi:EAL domain-containing protein (putative c-di-GMP-specific phosphodiesterase class I)
VRASVGVSTFPDHGIDPHALLSGADVAMYAAKAAGRNRVVHFNEQLHAAAANRLEITTRLQAAQSTSMLELHYQPQIAMKSGAIVGAEALLRWSDSALGNVPPDVFIPIAEADGQIHTLGAWVIEEAVRQSRSWLDAGLPPTRISVNVSPVQIEDARFVTIIQQSLKTHALPPHLLELELTEGALIRDVDFALQILKRLKEIGVSIAIDDFGTGYSSLASLQRFDIDRLKIDQRFVQAIGVTPRGEAVIDAVIKLAHALGFEILAEGVETEAQREFLIKSGCGFAQGCLFDKPLTAATMKQRLSLMPYAHADAPTMRLDTSARDEFRYLG